MYRHEAETHHLPLRTRRSNVAIACGGGGGSGGSGGGGGGGLYDLGIVGSDGPTDSTFHPHLQWLAGTLYPPPPSPYASRSL